jgi:MYXO-CTERM domain-containing protein
VQRNFVLGSAAVQAGHDNVAIYAGPGTQVVNNVIIGSNQGIAARLESEATEMRNLVVVTNTVLGATDNAFSIRGCQTADQSVVVTGNALLADDAAGYGYRMPDPVGSMIATANYYEGLDYAEAAPPVMNELTQPLTAIFTNPTTQVPGADLMPAAGSPLVDKADPATSPPVDFDLTMRPIGAGPDVGAYERGGDPANHWALALTFKGSSAMGGIPDAGGPGAGGSAGGAGGASGAASGGSPSGGCKCSVPGAPRGDLAAGIAGIAALAGIRRRRR